MEDALGHLEEVPAGRDATAPYNFVPLPATPVLAEQPLPRHDLYYGERHTGRIVCTLVTASPTYVRCGLTPANYQAFGETSWQDLSDAQRDTRAGFFHHPLTQRLLIPGSSLRGMFRTLVEIIGHGMMRDVANRPPIFFRAVAADESDPLKAPYTRRMKAVKAGYVEQQNGTWHIRPAQSDPERGLTYAWVRENAHVPKRGHQETGLQDHNLRSFVRLDDLGYRPQYIPVVFNKKLHLNGTRYFVDGATVRDIPANKPLAAGDSAGWLVTSGNMLETAAAGSQGRRQNHCVVFAPMTPGEPGGKLLTISEAAVADYRKALSPFQQEPPFDTQWGVLVPGHPVFYCPPEKPGGEVLLFGHSPNFRIPYAPAADGKAASPAALVPSILNDPVAVDLSEAIFGFARGQKSADDQARPGRVFFSDALCKKGANDSIWLVEGHQHAMTPQILSSPKPSAFQQYLEQPHAEKRHLRHYGSDPDTTRIRGYKLYWHQGNVGLVETQAKQEDVEKAPSQYTSIKAVKAEVAFEFTLRFENLSDVELGALLWVLKVAGDRRYRLSLGMGKPRGFGAVAITHRVMLSDRATSSSAGRYRQLFNDAGTAWQAGDEQLLASDSRLTQCVSDFESHVLAGLHVDSDSFNEQPRIKMLLTLLRWKGPERGYTRYLEIERLPDKDNEYKERRVLPTPLQVYGEGDQAAAGPNVQLYDPVPARIVKLSGSRAEVIPLVEGQAPDRALPLKSLHIGSAPTDHAPTPVSANAVITVTVSAINAQTGQITAVR